MPLWFQLRPSWALPGAPIQRAPPLRAPAAWLRPGMRSPGPGLRSHGSARAALSDPALPGPVRPGLARPCPPGLARPYPTLSDPVLPGLVLPGLVLPGLVLPGLVLPGLVLPGLVLPGPGLARPGPARSGLTWPCLIRPCPIAAKPAHDSGSAARHAWLVSAATRDVGSTYRSACPMLRHWQEGAGAVRDSPPKAFGSRVRRAAEAANAE
ncbi:hypothetical protein Aab01nite_59630 [Paractinoplanes abujensis]|nr:hypothetical protein Aab01nite_59630 [Actinoplanes abujensis]